MKKVDVLISVYGKPYQTAVTLFSLLKHSGQWIDKIYFVEERNQPNEANFNFLRELLSDRIVYYRPYFWWFYRNQLKWKQYFRIPFIRHSIRYQYGWEKSKNDFVLALHNDVYFEGDVVKLYLDNIGDHIGIGQIGQCWNCPASFAGKCSGEKYTEYRPSHEELKKLFDEFPPPEARAALNEAFMRSGANSWPLPECRLNEFFVLINRKMAAPLVWPKGDASPIGLFNYETGVQWFRDVVGKGFYPKHMNCEYIAKHCWASQTSSGHGALSNADIYFKEEAIAKELLEKEFGLIF